MTKDEAIRLQRALGVVADGIIGPGTLRALFARFNCPPAWYPAQWQPVSSGVTQY